MKVLFVCLGNICRSPAAQGIFESKIKALGLGEQISCDSAGTSGVHAGDQPDHRTIKSGLKKGYSFDHPCRKILDSDLEHFDLILAMDDSNLRVLKKMDKKGFYKHKIHLVSFQSNKYLNKIIPDPYLSNEQNFDLVITMLEDCCDGLIEYIKNQNT